MILSNVLQHEQTSWTELGERERERERRERVDLFKISRCYCFFQWEECGWSESMNVIVGLLYWNTTISHQLCNKQFSLRGTSYATSPSPFLATLLHGRVKQVKYSYTLAAAETRTRTSVLRVPRSRLYR